MWAGASEGSRWKREVEVLPKADGEARTWRDKELSGTEISPITTKSVSFLSCVKTQTLLSITHPKTKAVFASGNDRAGKVTAMQLTHTPVWMDKGHLSAIWGPKQHWKLVLKLNIKGIFALLVPHWQHEVLIQYTAAADLPSTSQRQISHSLKWAVSSTTPALLSALRDSVSPPVPSVSSLTSEPQSHCLILQTCLTTSGHLTLLSDLGAVMLVYRWDYSHSRQAAESETPSTFFLHLPQKTASLLNLQIAIVLCKKTQNQFLLT